MNLHIFSGTANLPLAEKIAQVAGGELGPLEHRVLPNGEYWCKYGSSIRGQHVGLIQSTSYPANDHFMQLFLMCQNAALAGARYMTIVIPFLGYSRQDRKDEPRVPLSSALMSALLDASSKKMGGNRRLIALDLHVDQIENAYPNWCTFDKLYAEPVFIDFFQRNHTFDPRDLVVASTDLGGEKRVQGYVDTLSSHDPAFGLKRRDRETGAKAKRLVGDVKDKVVLFVDDEIDTAGTIVTMANLAVEHYGAQAVYVCATHAPFSGDALKRIRDSRIEKVFVTDTIYHSEEKFREAGGKIVVVSVASLLGEALRRSHTNESLSELLPERKK